MCVRVLNMYDVPIDDWCDDLCGVYTQTYK